MAIDSNHTSSETEPGAQSAASYTDETARDSAKKSTRFELKSLGDKINASLDHWKGFLFSVGRNIQLTYNAMDSHVAGIRSQDNEEITVNYPLGQRADGSAITGTASFQKDQLINQYIGIVGYSMPVTGIYNLVIAVEAAIEDATRAILHEYPKKLKSDKRIPAASVFEAKSIEELRAKTVSDVLGELAYKSPRELAETLERVFSFPLLEIPQFHRYMEIKATRDIHMHNRGMANDTYRRKADTMARVQPGEWLPVTIQYFLDSYECCLKLIEVLSERFDSVWPSEIYRSRKNDQKAAGSEQSAPPNGGPATPPGDSAVAEGPPSVS